MGQTSGTHSLLGLARAGWRRVARYFNAAAIHRVLDGDPLAFAETRPTQAAAARIRSEQLSNIAQSTSIMMLATAFNASLFAIVMWDSPSAIPACIWAATLTILSAYMYVKRSRGPRPSRAASPRGIRLATVYALAHGALWGDLPAMFFQAATPPQQLVIVCLCIGMLCGGAFTLSPIPIATFAYIGPLVFASAAALTFGGEPIYNAVGGLLVVYTTVLVLAAHTRAVALARNCICELEKEAGALTDELTKLPNRAYFRAELSKALARYERNREHFAVMCFDLDGFKGVNDTMGHPAGDKVLVEAARRLLDATRKTDTVARLGGDEFALVAANVQTIAQATVVAQRIVESFRDPFVIDGQTPRVTISVGVALAPIDGDSIDTLMNNADSALYATKGVGRGGYTFFRERFSFVCERATLETELKRALANEELFLVFQPFVDISTFRTTGFEALLRWRHPVRGVLGAGEIVPLLERSGLIDGVGAWVAEKAIETAASWPPHLRISINVSPIQLNSPNLDRSIRAALERAGLEPGRVELELTESAMIGDCRNAVSVLGALHELGLRTALDDLGTGYSSLSSLVELPLDRIKIDRSFVADMTRNQLYASVVRISVELARAMKLQVTAEGVEDDRQLEMLRSFGCNEAQGYLFSKPVTIEEVSAVFEYCPMVEQNKALQEMSLAS